MCLVAMAYQSFPGYDLVLIANRDEYFNRPAEAAHFWNDAPDLLAGRDLKGCGTWMGVTRTGRFSLLTNFRDPANHRPDARSRGLLVSGYLRNEIPPKKYLENLSLQAGEYNGFNILTGSPSELFYLSSIENSVTRISPGLYGMSNHLFETPWPKVVRAREGLKNILEEATWQHRAREKETIALPTEELFQLLADPTPAPDDQLPETGVGRERERALSSLFISMPGYGTRCSTLLAMRSDGWVEFTERTWPEDRKAAPATVDFKFRL